MKGRGRTFADGRDWVLRRCEEGGWKLAELLPPHLRPHADGLIVRSMQYYLKSSPQTGKVELEDSEWGPRVFSRPWHQVSAEDGRVVLKALLQAGVFLAPASN